jgi:hypothetical protein
MVIWLHGYIVIYVYGDVTPLQTWWGLGYFQILLQFFRKEHFLRGDTQCGPHARDKTTRSHVTPEMAAAISF